MEIKKVAFLGYADDRLVEKIGDKKLAVSLNEVSS